MGINQVLQLNLGSKVEIIAYANDLAIHGGPIGEDILYKQITTALKKIETKPMQLGLRFSPDKCEALWYRSNDPDWNFKIAGEEIPCRASVKYLGVIIDQKLYFRKQIDYIRQKTDRNMNLLIVLNSLSDVSSGISLQRPLTFSISYMCSLNLRHLRHATPPYATLRHSVAYRT